MLKQTDELLAIGLLFQFREGGNVKVLELVPEVTEVGEVAHGEIRFLLDLLEVLQEV